MDYTNSNDSSDISVTYTITNNYCSEYYKDDFDYEKKEIDLDAKLCWFNPRKIRFPKAQFHDKRKTRKRNIYTKRL